MLNCTIKNSIKRVVVICLILWCLPWRALQLRTWNIRNGSGGRYTCPEHSLHWSPAISFKINILTFRVITDLLLIINSRTLCSETGSSDEEQRRSYWCANALYYQSAILVKICSICSQDNQGLGNDTFLTVYNIHLMTFYEDDMSFLLRPVYVFASIVSNKASFELR
jgi:hypothetical protein